MSKGNSSIHLSSTIKNGLGTLHFMCHIVSPRATYRYFFLTIPKHIFKFITQLLSSLALIF